MSVTMRVRAAFAGGVALLVLALSGVLAAVAAAAPAVLEDGKTSGYPTDAAASTMGAAAIIVTIVVIAVTAGVIAYAAFGLDRRGGARLRVVEGTDETTGASAPMESETERRKAA